MDRGEMRPMALKSLVPVLAGAAVLLALQSGCRDEIAPPTQGFVQVRWNDASEVQVYVDGVLEGTDVDLVGPIDAGLHSISLVRDGWVVDPPTAIEVSVAPAETTSVQFTLTAMEFGSVRVIAEDELDATEIEGAEIFQETSTGVFSSTGLFTPAVFSNLPVGPARFRVDKEGYRAGAVAEVSVINGTEVTAHSLLGPKNATLLEMFTYVTCPNCPYAADTLEVLHQDLPSQAYVIEWHSVSPLPLYDARWKIRERFYTAGAQIGYPSTTIAGELPLIVGAQSSELTQYRVRTQSNLVECGGDCPFAMRLTGTIGVSSAELTARVKWRGGVLPGNLKLRFVLIENHVVSPGNQPAFDFVAREMSEVPIAFAAPGEILVLPSTLPVLAWPFSANPPNTNCEAIAFIQSDDTKEILQVSGIP
jgi:hypothetical protein